MIKYKILSLFLYLSGLFAFILIATLLIISGFIFLPLFYKLVKFCARFMMSALLVVPKIKGAFPSDGTYIIMMNHSSFLDVFIFPLILALIALLLFYFYIKRKIIKAKKKKSSKIIDVHYSVK